MNRTPTEKIPEHLLPYVTEQNPALYTPMDHAAWRYIMRVSMAFFAKHAHPAYLRGIPATGMAIERIPLISEMDAALRELGWRAIAVNGFIPPSVFMEFQSLRVLAIACDMRKIENLGYTPAPDIVHEAAGHAPMVADPVYRRYLESYGEVARAAIISKQDLNLYEAVFSLSEIKENPMANEEAIAKSQNHFEKLAASITEISEAAYLSRMAWWTTEYGLVGPSDKPLIYGAGLLSSVSESYNCLKPEVKKIPLTSNCIYTSYDITRPQPQLFLARDFSELILALEEFSSTMAYRVGGAESLEKAKKADNTVTVVHDTGAQFSGTVELYGLDPAGVPAWYRMGGQKQVAADDRASNDVPYYKMPKSVFVPLFDRSVATNSFEAIRARLHTTGLPARDGMRVFGRIAKDVLIGNRARVLVMDQIRIEKADKVLFDERDTVYPLFLASEIPSVFGGAADRTEFAQRTAHTAASKVERHKTNLTSANSALNELYQLVRDYRESAKTVPYELAEVAAALKRSYPDEWLLRLEILELARAWDRAPNWVNELKADLIEVAKKPQFSELVQRGMALIA